MSSVIKLGVTFFCFAECRYDKRRSCCVTFGMIVIMLIVIMLNVITLNDIILIANIAIVIS